MKARRNASRCILILLTLLFLSGPCYAQDSAKENIGSHGYIDWIKQKVFAKGTGAPPEKYYGKPQARPMAMRAATSDARRNLLEVIKGVHIDSVTTVNNKMYRDDTIVTKVKGVLKSSTVDDIQYLSDGTVEALVSMPLTGELGQILLQSVVPASQKVPSTAAPRIEQRLQRLEDRVKTLEDRITRLKKVSFEQTETLALFKQFIETWLDYTANRPVLSYAGYAQDKDLQNLQQKLVAQENRLSRLSARLEKMAGRLVALEKPGAKGSQVAVAAKTKSQVPYSGLVIDARNIGFRPCLKPELFEAGQLIYPGDYVDFKTAVRSGFIRYYRKIGRAQQSRRAGALPFTIKAKGIYRGNRGLEIKSADYQTLKEIIKIPNNFLQHCNVVIVF